CVIWIPICIWVVASISWIVMGEVEAYLGIGSIAIAFTLGYFTSNPPTPWVGHLLFVVVIGTMAFFPFIRGISNKRMMVNIDIDQMENCYAMLRQRGDNPGTYFQMARLLFERGHVARSLSIGETALKSMPAGLFRVEHAEYKSWLQRSAQIAIQPSAPCPNCLAQIPSDAVICTRCNSEVCMLVLQGRSGGRGQIKKILAAWMLVVGLIIVIPIAASTLPIVASIPIIILGCAGGAVLLFRMVAETHS
ncbi:MAG: hypothetical protein K8R88_12900, partial [Armatimonadetes bacterium]|nr:hypothetical protein [Armatimonadota bacterium]